MVKKLYSKLEILKVFEDFVGWKTIKQISKEIKLSYQPTYTYLKELKEKGFLRHKREGNIHLYSLNLKNKAVSKVIWDIEFDKSQELMKKLNRKVNLVLTEFLEQSQRNTSLTTVLLFGSTARKTRTEKSDIDLFVIINGKDDGKIRRICNTLNIKYNLNLSPLVVSLDEFRKMLIERNKFTQDLIKEKVVLYGFESYFNELIKSMENLKWI